MYRTKSERDQGDKTPDPPDGQAWPHPGQDSVGLATAPPGHHHCHCAGQSINNSEWKNVNCSNCMLFLNFSATKAFLFDLLNKNQLPFLSGILYKFSIQYGTWKLL